MANSTSNPEDYGWWRQYFTKYPNEADKFFGKHVLLGFDQEPELHQLLDLDTTDDVENKEEDGAIPLDEMTEQILLCQWAIDTYNNSSLIRFSQTLPVWCTCHQTHERKMSNS